MHCLWWIADVSQYGVNDTSEVTQYIDNIISCQRTWGQQDLDSLVELQVHKHTRTCKKRFRNTTVCRFGFPKYPMHTTEILEPLICDISELKVHTQNLNHVKNIFHQLNQPKNHQLWKISWHHFSRTMTAIF